MNNIIWRVIAAIHFVFIVGVIISFIILPFKEPFYVWMPLEGFIINLFFNQSFKDCPITRIESYYRVKSGYPIIRSFIGYYIVKTYFKIKRKFR